MSDGDAGDFLARLTVKLTAAGEAANALADLLTALGATEVDSADMD
jgi:hypothetical protein